MTMNVTVVGGDRYIARMDAMPGRIHDQLFAEITDLSLALELHIKNDKLLGQVLNQRTGRLRSSIHSAVDDAATTITGRVFSAAPMPYAAIHEFGGVIPAHTVYPVKAAALRFMMGGSVVFAMKANIPDVNMPERSFMRSALTDMAGQITARLKDAVGRGAQENA